MTPGSKQLSAMFLFVVAIGCQTTPEPGEPLVRLGDEISICGQLYHTGTPVVLWNDPGGYDAYRVEPRFPELMDQQALEDWKVKAHYHSMRLHVPEEDQARIRREGWTVDELARRVDLFVLHYDVSGTSRRCFRTLQDRRYLSAHFMLDLDGTIYQTLDLKERAWHAAQANDRSVGIEISNVGAYPDSDAEALTDWYTRDEHGLRVVIPDAETGIRTEDFVPRPARDALVSGPIQGQILYQYDFTEQQYRALARLLATIHRVLPRIALDAPRDQEGRIHTRALSDEEYHAWSGLIAHYHVTDRKVDPGPAFDWDRVLEEARRLAD